jgi:hypothetical protein
LAHLVGMKRTSLYQHREGAPEAAAAHNHRSGRCSRGIADRIATPSPVESQTQNRQAWRHGEGCLVLCLAKEGTAVERRLCSP